MPAHIKSLKRIISSDRTSWLEARKSGIGGSEAAAIVGASPWLNATELWEFKTGVRGEKEVSDHEAISLGVRLEPVLREMFKAVHPELIVEHHPYDMLYQEDRPWLFATLDGEIIAEDRAHGILEVKTSTPNGKNGWAKWNGQIPQNYYIQCVHQLAASGFDFVILYAALFNAEKDVTIREYRIERFDCEEDLAWLIEKEEAFWQSVESKTMPPLSIMF